MLPVMIESNIYHNKAFKALFWAFNSESPGQRLKSLITVACDKSPGTCQERVEHHPDLWSKFIGLSLI